jgi:hypothetical protein
MGTIILSAAWGSPRVVRHRLKRRVLGWKPAHASFAEGLPPTLAALGRSAGS